MHIHKYALACQKILLTSSVRPGTEGTEIKTFFLASRPVCGFIIGVAGFFSDYVIIQLDLQVCSVQVILKEANTLKPLLMHPKDNIPLQLKHKIVYK